MVQASIKRESDAENFTGGKAYPVIGITGACVVVVDDASKFRHVSFTEIEAEWEVSTAEAEKAEPKKTEDKTLIAGGATPAAEPTDQGHEGSDEQGTTQG